jgi:hypothetical protein
MCFGDDSVAQIKGCGRGDEVAWCWHERFRHVNMVTLRKLAREAGAWDTRDRSSGAVVRGMSGREAMTHLVPGEGGVSGGTTPGAGAW